MNQGIEILDVNHGNDWRYGTAGKSGYYGTE
jgi:hypothetical protein